MSLFNKYEALNEEGREIADEIDTTVRVWLDQWIVKRGLSTVEIEHIITTSAQCIIAEYRIRRAVKARQAEREN